MSPAIALPPELNGRYKIAGRIGSGGFGDVYKARDLALDRDVAIKVLTSDLPFDDEMLARFEREAKVMSNLKQKNIVSVYSHGIYESAPYLVLEYVEGKTLEAINSSGKEAMSLRQSAEIARQICDALSCAHAHGAVHRDLKPGNILISQTSKGEPIVKLIDFGLVSLLPGSSADEQRLTRFGETVGTPAFMAPEQCTGQPCDGRIDIYALGCILFRCITGHLPFRAVGELELMAQHVDCPIPNLSEFLTPSPTLLLAQKIIDRALQKIPDLRYQAASEMAADLEQLIAQSDAASQGEQIKPAPSARKRRSITMPLGAVPLAVATGLVLFFCLQPQTSLPGAHESNSLQLWEEITRMGFQGEDNPAGYVPALEAAIAQAEKDRMLDDARLFSLYRALAREYDEASKPADEVLKVVKKVSATRDRLGQVGATDRWAHGDDLLEARTYLRLGDPASAKAATDRIFQRVAQKQYRPDATVLAALEWYESTHVPADQKATWLETARTAASHPDVSEAVRNRVLKYLKGKP